MIEAPGAASPPGPAGSRLRVAVITDDRLSADGILRILEADTSFESAWNGDAGDAVIENADLVLLDSRTAGALACCGELTRERRVPVILLAAPDDDTWAADALAAGARGILGQSAGAGDLLSAVRAVSGGVIWAPRRVLSTLVERLARVPVAMGPRALDQQLSLREREICHHAVRGLGNKELAACLAISEATVKVHLTHIFRKLGVRGRSELAAFYYGITSRAGDAAVPRPFPPGPVASVSSPPASAIIRKS